MWVRRDEEALKKYETYQSGLSLSGVALKFNCTRQSVYELFKNRGWKLRTQTRKEFIEFNGFKYTKRKDGYYRKTNGNRGLLHKDVWIYYNGDVDKNYDVHHKDKNLDNNSIENLQLLSKSEHGKMHSVEGHIIFKSKRGEQVA
jgi:hypothetical protein